MEGNNRDSHRRQRPREKASRSQGVKFTILIAVIVLVYILPRMVSFLLNDNMNYVIARQGSMQESTTVQGIVTRQEQLCQSVSSGVVEYYYPGTKALSKNTVVCTIRDNAYYGDLLDQKLEDVYTQISSVSDNEYASSFTELEASISHQVNTYLRSKDSNTYSSVYTLKDSLKSAVQRRQDLYSLFSGSQVQKLLEEQGVYQSVVDESSENLWISDAGIIAYSYDGYEGWDASLVDEKFVENYDAVYKYLNINMQQVKAGDPLYRLITSQNWYITVFIDEAMALELNPSESGTTALSFSCDGSDTMTGYIYSLEEASDERYKLVIEVRTRVQDYLDKRIVTIAFDEGEYKGLKVPNDCLVEQEFYKIPAACVFRSEDQSGVMKRSDAGDAFVAVDFEWNTDEYYYFSLPEGLMVGDILLQQGVDETTMLGEMEKSFGVYVVNGGNQEYYHVEVLHQANGYSIIEGINAYDHVMLIEEQVE